MRVLSWECCENYRVNVYKTSCSRTQHVVSAQQMALLAPQRCSGSKNIVADHALAREGNCPRMSLLRALQSRSL